MPEIKLLNSFKSSPVDSSGASGIRFSFSEKRFAVGIELPIDVDALIDSNIVSDANAERIFASTIGLVSSIDAKISAINLFVSAPSIVINITDPHMPDAVFFTSTANIVSGITSDADVGTGYDWDSFTGDDFAGANGAPPNPDYWIPPDGTYTNFEIKSNQLWVNQNNNENSKIESLFKVSGDFDIRLKWERETFFEDHYFWFYSQLYIDDDNYIQGMRGFSGNHQFYVTGKNDGIAFNGANQGNITTGGFRFTRTGSSLNAYKWYASSWTSLLLPAPETGFSTGSCIYKIGGYGDAPGHLRSILWDDFEVISGTVSDA